VKKKNVINHRILSGIQPSGALHIGNYFGAIRQHIELQQKNECYYFVANYHAMTTIKDPGQLRENSMLVAVDYLALGFSPDCASLFLQTDVREVAELAWILSTVIPLGMLERAHSYKDKIAKGIAPSHGLFAYPVLMAADILIYDSEYVPVGKDQKQHLEMTRDMALKLNALYGDEVLVIPKDLILDEVAVVPGVDGQKMSKSYDNTIEIFQSFKQTKSKLMRIVTDSKGLEDPKDPDNTIVHLYKLFADPKDVEAMREKLLAGGYGYGHAKKELLDTVWAYFEPHRNRREELLKNLDFVEDVLRKGALQAREKAETVMQRVRKACGLQRFV